MLSSLEKRMLEIFHYLHEHPEVSFQEYQTTTYIADLLQNEGIKVQTFKDTTGLIAEIGQGKPIVAVRADMDALWQEVDGEMKANHSCGHDAHMSIVIGLLLSLKERATEFKGTLRCIFQPAEEKGNGALKMVEKGIVDDVDYLFGVHLRPKEELELGFAAPSIRHGAAIFLEGKIIGEDTHGARPHLGVNAIEVGYAIQNLIRSIPLSPFIPQSIKMTSFHAGSTNYNIIPGSATFSLDIRSQDNQALNEIKRKVERAIKSLEEFYQVKIDINWMDYTPAAEVSEEAEAIMRESIEEVLGKNHCVPPIVTPGSDDFHFYTIKRPNLKACMLALGANLTPGLHHPHMTFDKSCLMTGVKILEKSVLKIVGK
jgi:amidohydrolase